MSNKCFKRINQRLTHRFSTTTAVKQCIRHKSTLPIPGKRYQKGDNSVALTRHNKPAPTSPTPGSAYPPWQHRSVTLHDQCYKLPQLIIARIESISNAKIETISTITPQKTDVNNNPNINDSELEIFGNTSSLSAFFPSEYFQVTITGDGNAVDHAMQIYIYYSQVCLSPSPFS